MVEKFIRVAWLIWGCVLLAIFSDLVSAWMMIESRRLLMEEEYMYYEYSSDTEDDHA